MNEFTRLDGHAVMILDLVSQWYTGNATSYNDMAVKDITCLNRFVIAHIASCLAIERMFAIVRG